MEQKYNSCTGRDFKLCLSLLQLKTNVFINCKIPILKPKSPQNTHIIPLSFPRKTDLLEKQVKILEFLHDWKPYKINWHVIFPWLKSLIPISLYSYKPRELQMMYSIQWNYYFYDRWLSFNIYIHLRVSVIMNYQVWSFWGR